MDTTKIPAALLATLNADNGAGGVLTLLPDGAWFGLAPAGKTRFVVVSQVSSHDVPQFQSRSFESLVYLVKAVHLSSSATTATTAAARINALLDFQVLTVAGYTHVWTERIEHVQYLEVDEQEADLRWQHCGGLYEIFAS